MHSKQGIAGGSWSSIENSEAVATITEGCRFGVLVCVCIVNSVCLCPEAVLGCLAIFCKHDGLCAKELITLINENAHQAVTKNA